MKFFFLKFLLKRRNIGVFSSVLTMLLLPAPPLKAENSPNNGAYYDIKKGNIYYE